MINAARPMASISATAAAALRLSWNEAEAAVVDTLTDKAWRMVSVSGLLHTCTSPCALNRLKKTTVLFVPHARYCTRNRVFRYIVTFYRRSVCDVRIYTVGQKTGPILKICSSCMWRHRITFYTWAYSVLYKEYDWCFKCYLI